MKAREFAKDSHVLLLDLTNAYNSIPYESIVNGLHKMGTSYTIIKYIVYMLQSRTNRYTGSLSTGLN